MKWFSMGRSSIPLSPSQKLRLSSHAWSYTTFFYPTIFYMTTIRKICFTWPKYDIIVAYNKHLAYNWDISTQTMYIRLHSLEIHKFMNMWPIIEGGGVIFVLTHPVRLLAYFTFFKKLFSTYRYVVLDK